MPLSWEGQVQRTRTLLLDWLSTTDLVQDAVREERTAGLAEQLGVQPDTFDEACRLAVANLNLAPIVRVSVFVPWELVRCLRAMYASSKWPLSTVIRSLLHLTMQTTWEPHQRSPQRTGRVQWQPLNAGAARRRAQLLGHPDAGPLGRKASQQVWVTMPQGLAKALEARAAAWPHGRNRHQYIVAWLADLVDGVINRALDLRMVEPHEAFANERQYVLPRLVREDSDG